MTIDPELLTGLGAAIAMFLSAAGSAIACSHSGTFAVRGPTMKDFVPIVISGVLGIYGIIVSVLLVGKYNQAMTTVDGYRNVSAGLSVGLACLASGHGIASFIRQCNEAHTASAPARTGTGDREPLLNNGVAGAPTRPDFVKLCLVLCFLESIGLYGLIVALFLMG